ncbi:MAG: NAD(P)(+) transhydrogenase (Re/Si-specific) subunit beta, partial [Rhodospirillaceae bacterium]|nr:NAD(P)(+) transhydrogenase (Re/Si-specific) subunit beta [Rhodospirillaceae bacterium]
MSPGATLFAYIVAGVFFILTLRGLSSPETSRKGNMFGMVGMAIAIFTTLTSPVVQEYVWIVAGIAAGGAIGVVIAKKIEMTALPQLVAAFHSLVGLAAVLVATSALLSPTSYGLGEVGSIAAGSLVEMSIGLAIGAITFSGSIIAFAKLQGLMTGNPLVFKGQHLLNALLGIAILVLVVMFCLSENHNLFFALMALSFLIGFLLILPIGGADMPVVVSMLNSYSGWAAAGIGFTLHNSLLIIVGALVGSSGAILSYIMCKGMNRSIF